MIATIKKPNANLKYHQGSIFKDQSRFNVIVCGRRFGKTTTLLFKLLQKACDEPGLYGYFAPTYKQAKLIAWRILKLMVPPHYREGKPNESELYIRLKNGSELRLFGMDNSENILGIKLHGGICDEYDQMDAQAVKEVLRPAVSDTKGFIWYCGTPDATRGQIKSLYEDVNREKKQTKRKNWSTFKYTSIDGGYIDADEIDEAKEELDERTFRQQYLASFETAEGKVYYAFDFDENVTTKAIYNPKMPIRMYWDFNVDPFCAGFAHQIPYIGKDDRKPYFNIHAFDELVIRNSNTYEMCREALRRYENHRAGIIIYGDATSTARNTAASKSDYGIIQEAFKNVPGFQLRFKKSNPIVKERLACVNSKLTAYDGSHHAFIHPKCKYLIKDFLDVQRKQGSMDIDKTNIELTHASDAFGYYADYEFPVTKGFIA